MRIEPWKVMIGLSVLLIIFGVVISLRDLSVAQILFYGIILAGILAAMYFGYRLGNVLGKQKR